MFGAGVLNEPKVFGEGAGGGQFALTKWSDRFLHLRLPCWILSSKRDRVAGSPRDRQCSLMTSWKIVSRGWKVEIALMRSGSSFLGGLGGG